MKKICVITGGSSGIGKATAAEMLKKGYTVYELSRHGEPPCGVKHITADVTDEDSLEAAVTRIIEADGKIDVLINNAGFGISGAAEFTETAAAVKQLDVNFFGAVRMCRAVLPYMRNAGKGRIVNIGSVASAVPIPFQSFYSASKAAIASYTMALANEVKPFGITVVCVQPGDIKTGFTAAREKTAEGDGAYGGRIARSVEKMEKDEQSGMLPETAGKYIARVADKKTKKPICTIGFSYKLVCFLAEILPSRLLNAIVYRLYAG